MTFLRAHQIQRRLQPRLLAAVPVDVQQDRFQGISPFPWKRSLGLCWLSLITHGYRCKFRGAVEPNRICRQPVRTRSEEPTSELQYLLRNSYAVLRLKKTKQ